MVRTGAIIAATFILLTALELLFPLRRSVESKARRIVRNLTLAGLSYALLLFLQAPLLLPLVGWVQREGVGVVHWLRLPRIAAFATALVLLDYTLWIWHWLNHKVPLLWRFHLVHHVDRDMDASTALRFHFGELVLSVGYRALQIVVIGADIPALLTWQAILFVCILFHHSNVRLPARVDRALVRVVVTPRMHGIHHSDRHEETDSNWSSILTVWDYLHRTMRTDVPQESITIGVPAYQEPRAVTIGKLLLLPFRRKTNDWVRRTLPA